MTIVRYKRADLILQAIGCLVIAGGSAWGFTLADSVKLQILLGIVAVSLPIAAMALGIRATGDLTALSFDDRNVTACSLWQRVTVPWAGVKSIHRETLQRSSMFGLFKQTLGWYLVVVTHDGDGFEKRIKLNEKLLDRPQDSLHLLLREIEEAHAASLVRRQNQFRAAEPSRTPAPRPEAPLATRPTFGRRGL